MKNVYLGEGEIVIMGRQVKGGDEKCVPRRG